MFFSFKTLGISYRPSILKNLYSRIKSSKSGYRIINGLLWSLIGIICSRGLMLLAAIIVARILGKEGFGEFGVLQSTVGMLGAFAGFGLGLTASKNVAEFRFSAPNFAGRIVYLSNIVALLSGGLMALSLFLSAEWLAVNTINAPQLTNALKIGSVMLFIDALIGAQNGALIGFEAFKAMARVNIFVGLISFTLLILGTWLYGVSGAASALGIVLSVNWCLNHFVLQKELLSHNATCSFKESVSEFSVLWKFSFPVALSSAMIGPVNWICTALLVNQPNGYGEMGLFNAANQWRMVIIFIPAMLCQVMLPILSNLNGSNENLEYRKLLKINIFLNAGISLLLALPISLAAQFIMNTYGPGFKSGSSVLVCLSLNAVLIAINGVVGQVIITKGHVWIGLFFNFLWAATLISLSYVSLKLGYGAIGLAIANLIAYFFHSIWQSLYVFKVKV